jgi:hypothetical protein
MKDLTISIPSAVAAVSLVFMLGACVPGCGAINLGTPPPPKATESFDSVELPRLGDADRALLSRLLPHIRQTAQEQIQGEFKKVADDLQAGDVKAQGFGTALGAMIAWFVHKVIAAVIVSVILSALMGLAIKYWMYPAGCVAMWLAVTAMVSALVAKKVKS